MATPIDKTFATLDPREVITRAVDILMGRHGVSQAEAFEMLVQSSADSSDKVRETAVRIVADASRSRRGQGDPQVPADLGVERK